MDSRPVFTVSQFIELVNQTFSASLPSVFVEGEVASYKVNQGKWVFFDLKDQSSTVPCFLPLFKLRAPLVDGMKVRLRATPKLTNWGKFSLVVEQIIPVGEGSIKKSFELLKAKLQKEGLFSPAKKRPLPDPLSRIGIISSTQAAGYADFIKIINQRWGGLEIKVAHTGVQGLSAADQIIRALNFFNQQREVELIAILRGGGSADDLAVFNDELLVRAIASSRIPVITGIGHEIDESLSDLAADIRAATPSNLAEITTKDRRAEQAKLNQEISRLKIFFLQKIQAVSPDQSHQLIRTKIITEVNQKLEQLNRQLLLQLKTQLLSKVDQKLELIMQDLKLLESLNPNQVLARGYAILSGKISPGSLIEVTTATNKIKAEVKHVKPYQN